MKVVGEEILINEGRFAQTGEYKKLHTEILNSIKSIVWPPGSDKFTIYQVKQANGVSPIKGALLMLLPAVFAI